MEQEGKRRDVEMVTLQKGWSRKGREDVGMVTLQKGWSRKGREEM